MIGGIELQLEIKTAENLRRLRMAKSAEECRKVTQGEVARAIGCDISTIGNYESGRTIPDYENAWKLADFYGVSIDVIGGRLDGPT